jgi:hypothetical protein
MTLPRELSLKEQLFPVAMIFVIAAETCGEILVFERSVPQERRGPCPDHGRDKLVRGPDGISLVPL